MMEFPPPSCNTYALHVGLGLVSRHERVLAISRRGGCGNQTRTDGEEQRRRDHHTIVLVNRLMVTTMIVELK